MLRLAGFSSGSGVGARGSRAARWCRSIGAGESHPASFRSVSLKGAVTEFFSLACRVLRSVRVAGCRGILRSVYACYAVLLPRLVFVSRLLFAAGRQTGRLAMCCVPIPPWVGIAIRAFSKAMRLSGFVGSLRERRLFMAIPTGNEETRGRSWRRGVGDILRNRIGLAAFSTGSTLGLKCGSRTAASLDSLHLIRGHVRFTRGGLVRFTRAQTDFVLSETCPAPTMWLPHCGWSGRSCGVRRQQADPALPAG